jgi:hypothetical protein
MSMTAVLSLARSELKGVELQIGSGQLARWLAWRVHADLHEDRPYAPRITGEQGKFALSTAGACLVLVEHEVHNLDWVLGAAAEPLVRAARDLCDQWRIHRFARVDHSTKDTDFAIVRMEREQWRSVLRFAHAHDFDRGKSPWHCFDGSGACLKVLGMGGIQLICDAFSPSARFVDSDNVLVTWTAPDNSHFNGMWDAETAHEWLLQELLPAMGHCEDPEHSRCSHGSEATYDMPAASVPALDIRMLEKSIARLQEFVALQVARPPPRYLRSILRVAHRLVSMRPALDERYVRGNFALRADEPVLEGLARRLAEPARVPRRVEVNLALRGSLAVARSIQDADPGALRFAATELHTLWDFYQDHMVLRHWIG